MQRGYPVPQNAAQPETGVCPYVATVPSSTTKSNATRMIFVLLLLLGVLSVHSCPANAVALDTAKITESLLCRDEEIYAGEFSCLPDTANGTRTLVRMAVVLHNPTECDYSFQPQTPLRIFYNLSDSTQVLRSGYFNVSCVRDSSCYKGHRATAIERFEFYSACRTGGISANCTSYLSNRAVCQWVDITSLPLEVPYTLTLQLQPSVDGLGAGLLDETPINITFTPLNIRKSTNISTGSLVLVILAFTLPFAILYVISFIFLCRRDRDVVIRYQFSVETN
jgi:hypothetical protein